MLEITLKISEDLARDAQEFGISDEETILELVRSELDRRVMDFVNAEIHAYRADDNNEQRSSLRS